MRNSPPQGTRSKNWGALVVHDKANSGRPRTKRFEVSALVVAVHNSIRLRDEYVARMHEYVHRGGWQKLHDDISDLIDLLRLQTIDVVERILEWQQHIGKPKPFTHGVFPNYILVLPHSMDFLSNVQGFEEWLGMPTKRNPLFIPNGPAALDSGRWIVPHSQANIIVGFDKRRLRKGAYCFINNVHPDRISAALRAMNIEERLFGPVNPNEGTMIAAQVIEKLRAAFGPHQRLLHRSTSSSKKEFEKTAKLVGLKLVPAEWKWLRKNSAQTHVGDIPQGHFSHAKLLALMRRKSAPLRANPSESRRHELQQFFGASPTHSSPSAKTQKPSNDDVGNLMPLFRVEKAQRARDIAQHKKSRADATVQENRRRVSQLEESLSSMQGSGAVTRAKKKAFKFRRQQVHELLREAHASLDDALARQHEATLNVLHSGAELRAAQKNLHDSRVRTEEMTRLMAAQTEAMQRKSLDAQGSLDRFKRAEVRCLLSQVTTFDS